MDQRSTLGPAHIHGVFGTSIHLCLPAKRAIEVCEAGWGEAHQYADHGTEIMVYGPRDPTELDFAPGLLKESVGYARAANG